MYTLSALSFAFIPLQDVTWCLTSQCSRCWSRQRRRPVTVVSKHAARYSNWSQWENTTDHNETLCGRPLNTTPITMREWENDHNGAPAEERRQNSAKLQNRLLEIRKPLHHTISIYLPNVLQNLLWLYDVCCVIWINLQQGRMALLYGNCSDTEKKMASGP